MLRRLLLPLMLCLIASNGWAAPAPLIIEHTFLSVDIKGQPAVLQALVVKESGRQGRLPVALITHGVSGNVDAQLSLEASSFTQTARDFARRGWLAVAVVRRGFGKSSPQPINLQTDCRLVGFGASLDIQTDDIEAALVAIAKRADADSQRTIALGVSVGGAVVLNLASRAPTGLRAVVNISGGIRSETQGDKVASCAPASLTPIFASYGTKSRLPTLWLYAENDSFFPGDYVRGLHETYVGLGGRTEFHMFPPIGKDGHNIFDYHDGKLAWIPVLDRFLRTQELPSFNQAKLDASLRAQSLSRAARAVVQSYHGRATEKALAVNKNGTTAWMAYGYPSPEKAAEQSLEKCAQEAHEACSLLWLNFDVVEPAN